MGNGGDWKQKAGYQTTHTPTEHSALSFSPEQAGADPTYGHIAFRGAGQIRRVYSHFRSKR